LANFSVKLGTKMIVTLRVAVLALAILGEATQIEREISCAFGISATHI
jgi:hypothetical protein